MLVRPPAIAASRQLPFEVVALVLQGGALGAYQAGVFEAPAEARKIRVLLLPKMDIVGAQRAADDEEARTQMCGRGPPKE